MVALNISEEDIDALARIVYAEAQSIAQETGDLKAAYGSALDVVLNRVAANQRHYGGASIQDVIDHTNGGVYYQFEPIQRVRGNTWRNLEKPPQSVYDTVRSQLSALQRGTGGNVVGKATHFLNPDIPGTASARRGWARDWSSWPVVGNPDTKNSHRFGSADPGVVVPVYTVSFQPRFLPAPPAPAEGASPAEQYQYAGLTRSLAPFLPVDRAFNTPEAVYSRMATTGGLGGILGLDARGVGGLGGMPDGSGVGGLGRDRSGR
jgi:hypothetical protein